jgi:putative metallopeptidase DUF4344
MYSRAWIALIALTALLWTESTVGGEAQTGTSSQDLLTFRYVKPTSREFDGLSETLRESRILEVWTTYVGVRLRGLPIKLEVAFAECGKEDSLYEPVQGVITLCYEEIHRSYVTLMTVGCDSDRLLVAWIGTMLSELYHELAHALIHKLTLPIAGRDEDAADQFAVLALLRHPQGEDLAVGSADYFQDMARLEKEAGADPSQRHSLYAQRYFNVLCWIYGSDPEAHGFLVEQGRLPEARATTCRVEYLRAAHAWDTLLAPFIK